jgi:hypothetical protein
MWHGTKSMSVMASQNGSKLHVMYDVYNNYLTWLLEQN